jgi:hypothetical protein
MAAFGAVLQIPLQVPVMTRELANKMYHPLAYLYGRLCSQYLVQIIPPTIMFFGTFWAVGIEYSYNLLWIYAFSLAGDQVWTTMGFFIGLTVSDEGDAAKIVLVFANIVFLSVNGGIVNPEKSNWFVKYLSKSTPGRYVTEGFFTSLLEGVSYTPEQRLGEPNFEETKQTILDDAGYSNSLQLNLALLYAWLAVWIIGCTFSIMWKYGRI